MDIATLRPSSTLMSATQIRQAVADWRVGQVLEARVVSSSDPSSVTLKVGDLVLTTQGTVPQRLLQGTLQLQVQSVGPQPTLRIIVPAIAPDTPGADALRRALPRQQPLPPLLANLTGLAARSAASLNAIPRPVLVALDQLMAAIPDAKQLSSADGVARALQDSGLFLERKLRTRDPLALDTKLAHDFKAALLRTAAAVRSAAMATNANASGNEKGATSATLGNTMQMTAATARNPSSSLTTPLSPETSAAPALRTTLAATLAIADDAATKDTDASSAPATTSRSNLAESIAALPPLRGGAVAPQARAEPTITAALPPALILRELADQLEGAVARLTTAQASQLPNEENSRPLSWTFELPVRHQSHIDVVGVHIERDESNNQENNARHGWHVTLSFDFPETGAFYAQLKVLGKAVTCRFTAERDQTLQRLQSELKKLDQSLRDAGLEVGELGARQGTMPRAQQSLFGPLLDLRA